MIQNSLERIFEGLCATLRENILPEVSDPWVRIQVEAATGLLTHLASRVEWRCADLMEEVIVTRAVFLSALEVEPDATELAAAARLLADPLPASTDNEALLGVRNAHLAALAGVQAWAARREDAGSVREALRRLLAARLEADLAQLSRSRRGERANQNGSRRA